MPRKAKELSALQVKRLSEPGLHAVGGVAGLQMQVKDSGARSWILRTMVGKKRRDIGLGGFPDVGLADARNRARELKHQIREEGKDPVLERRRVRSELISAQSREMTFRDAAEACYKVKAPDFKNVKHAAQWISSLREYAFPVLGSLPVSEIEQPQIIRALEPIWQTKTETASRVRGRIETVLAWATVNRFREGDNPARWRGNLAEALPKPKRKGRHMRALPWPEIGSFLEDLRQQEGIAARALEFAILTAARSGEVRLATWDEIDFDRKLWTIPEDRMKAGKPHNVPLSAPAVKLLKGLPRMEGCEYVFPAPRGGHLSDMALSQVCRRMKVDAVPHGFRSTFKDWCRSSTSYADEVSELALAHVNSDATRAAYARDELLAKRARLMRDWAKYCGTMPVKADVTPIRAREHV